MCPDSTLSRPACPRTPGNAKVPDHYKVDGVQLGKWVGKQRQKHRVGGHSSEQTRRIESLPGWSWRII
ncbi:MAG: helicase associated domain-containing protein [Actinomycetota bacterium]